MVPESEVLLPAWSGGKEARVRHSDYFTSAPWKIFLVALPWLSKRSSLNRGTRSSGVDILGRLVGTRLAMGVMGGYLDYLEAVIKHANSSLGLEKWGRMEGGATPRRTLGPCSRSGGVRHPAIRFPGRMRGGTMDLGTVSTGTWSM